MRRGGAALSILFCNEDCSLVHTSVLVTERREGSGRGGERREGVGREEKAGRGGSTRRGGKNSAEKKKGGCVCVCVCVCVKEGERG